MTSMPCCRMMVSLVMMLYLSRGRYFTASLRRTAVMSETSALSGLAAPNLAFASSIVSKTATFLTPAGGGEHRSKRRDPRNRFYRYYCSHSSSLNVNLFANPLGLWRLGGRTDEHIHTTTISSFFDSGLGQVKVFCINMCYGGARSQINLTTSCKTRS